MYLMKTVLGESLVEESTAKEPFGPGFTAEQANAADRMDVWGSSYSDPGEDFCEFKLFSGVELLAVARIVGF